MEVDDPIAIPMAIDEKLMLIDGGPLNKSLQQHRTLQEFTKEEEEDMNKNDDDKKQASEKNVKINENENVQAVNVNVNANDKKEEIDNTTIKEINSSLSSANKEVEKEILDVDKLHVLLNFNKKEKVEKKIESKDPFVSGDEKLKPKLRRKLLTRSSASPLKQLDQQGREHQHQQELPTSIKGSIDDEELEHVNTMKRKRHSVRKSGSDEYLLGFHEQSGEAELVKINNDEKDTFTSGALVREDDESPSKFKLKKVITSVEETSEKPSDIDMEIKDEEDTGKFINSHIVGDNDDTGVMNKKLLPQSKNNSKILGAIPNSSASTSSPGVGAGGAGHPIKRSPQSDFYKKPFEYGWKRELVWRANLETSKDKADVYFISPTGKKLRSRSDIVPLLEGDLTIEHFCFAREPLGAGPEAEIVRSAKPSSRTTVAAATLAAAPSPTNIGKRIIKPKGPKGASPPPQGWTPSQALKVNNAALLSSTNAAHRHSSSYQYHYHQHHHNQATTTSTAGSPSSSNRRGQNSEIQSLNQQQNLSQTSTSLQTASHCGSGSTNKSSSKAKKSITTTETTSTTSAQASDIDSISSQQQLQQQHFENNSSMVTTTAATTTTSIQILVAHTHVNSIKNNITVPREIIKNAGIAKTPTTSTTGATTITAPLRKEVMREPCSVTCIKAPGLVPQLQCVKCLCHYHHQCMGLPVHDNEYRSIYNTKGRDYICENCTEKDKVALNKKVTSHSTIRRSETENRYLPQSIAVVKGKKYIMVARPLLSASGNPHVNDIESDLKQINESIRQNRKHSFETGNSTTMNTSGSSAITMSNAMNSHINNNSNNAKALITSQEHQHNKMFVNNFFANISYAYGALLNILKYLKIHERSRAASVCKLWNLAAKDTSLWHTVRMKNSKVCNWSGFTAALRRGETKHLDLRKMLLSNTRSEEFWLSFSQCIGTVCSLEMIDLCRCSSRVVEGLFSSNPNLKILNAMAINDDTLNLDNIHNMRNLKELRLRPCELLTLVGDLMPLATLTQLTHLSLTAIRGLGDKNIEILGKLIELRTLELGECGDFETRFADEVLPKLLKLQRLRLENGQQTNCCTLAILDGLAQLPQLNQLELVNFDIKIGFDDKLRLCRHLTKLMIIPTYISQSATTNRIVLSAVQKVADTLKYFTWVVTVELLRVTALYVDQCDESMKKEKHHFDECIPVLKPVPGAPPTFNDTDDDDDNVKEEGDIKKERITNALTSNNKDVDGEASDKTEAKKQNEDNDDDDNMTDGSEVPQIEILPLDKVEMILAENLPHTKFTIVKVPYHQTSKQHLVE